MEFFKLTRVKHVLIADCYVLNEVYDKLLYLPFQYAIMKSKGNQIIIVKYLNASVKGHF